MFGPIFRKLNFDIEIKSGFGQLMFSTDILHERLTKSHEPKNSFDIILILLAFHFLRNFFFFAKSGGKFEKIPFFRSNNLFFLIIGKLIFMDP